MLSKEEILRENSLREYPLREKPLRENALRENPLREDPLREDPLKEDTATQRVEGTTPLTALSRLHELSLLKRALHGESGTRQATLEQTSTLDHATGQDTALQRVTLDVAARSSPLSRAQVREVQQLLQRVCPTVTLHPCWLVTQGDRDKKTPLSDDLPGDFFTDTLDRALLEGGCDIAIHSAKDLPSELAEPLEIIAITKGVDPSDVLVLRPGLSVEELKRSTSPHIGTSGPRRTEMVLSLLPGAQLSSLRGTIAERLEQLDRFDAIVMAKAALIRLGIKDYTTYPLVGRTPQGQGQLAIVACKNHPWAKRLFRSIDWREKRPKTLYLGSLRAQDTPSRHFPSIGETTPSPVIKTKPLPLREYCDERQERSPSLEEVAQAWIRSTHVIVTSPSSARYLQQLLEQIAAHLRAAEPSEGSSTQKSLSALSASSPQIDPNVCSKLFSCKELLTIGPATAQAFEPLCRHFHHHTTLPYGSTSEDVVAYLERIATSIVGEHIDFPLKGQNNLENPSCPDALFTQVRQEILNPQQRQRPKELSEECSRTPYFFYPRSTRSRPLIRDYLNQKGWSYVSYQLYTTEDLPLKRELLDQIYCGHFDEIVLTSPSSVESFARQVEWEKIVIPCHGLGKTTQKALEKYAQDANLGFSPII